MNKNKKIIIPIIIILLFIVILGLISFIVVDKIGLISQSKENTTNIDKKKLADLPLPEVTGGERGKLGIDKNINETNIDYYLGRSDSVYRDMRMLQDPGNYEAIGGDSYLSGYINGFEVVSLPYLVNVTGLPKEVGNTYLGETLFTKDKNGNYSANYKESLSILENLFPKDKNIFLICGGGGYSGMTKNLLVALGWNANKIYNIGGFWYYDGKNRIDIKKEVNGKVIYEFDKVPYHNIEFNKLTKIESTNISNFKGDNNQNNNTIVEENIENSKQKVRLDTEYYGKKTDKKFDIELDLSKVMDYIAQYSETISEAEYEKKSTEIMEEKVNILENLIAKKSSFVVIVLDTNNACSASEDGQELGNKFAKEMSNLNIYCYKINLPIFKKTSFYKTVKYAPSIVVFNKGKIFAYTDANIDSFDDNKQIKTWISKNIELNK